MKEYLVALSRAYKLPQRIQVARYLSVGSLANAQTDVFQAYIGAISLDHGAVALDDFVKSILDSIPHTDEVWNTSAAAPHPPVVSGVISSTNASESTPASGHQRSSSARISVEHTSISLSSQNIPPPYAPSVRSSTPSERDSLYGIPSVQASPIRTPQEFQQQELWQQPEPPRQSQRSPEQQRNYHREDDSGLVQIPAKRPLPAFDSPLRKPPQAPQATFAAAQISASISVQDTATVQTSRPNGPPSSSQSSSNGAAGTSSTSQLDRTPPPHLPSFSPAASFLDFTPDEKPTKSPFNDATSPTTSSLSPEMAHSNSIPLTSQSSLNHLNGMSKPLPPTPVNFHPPSAPADLQPSSQSASSKNGT